MKEEEIDEEWMELVQHRVHWRSLATVTRELATWSGIIMSMYLCVVNDVRISARLTNKYSFVASRPFNMHL